MIQHIEKTSTVHTASAVLLDDLNQLHPSLDRKILSRRVCYLAKMVSWHLAVAGSVFFKRFMDIVLSLLSLVALSPVFLLATLAVKLSDGGPILFWQMRVGQGSKLFRLPKFRSMVVDAEGLKAALAASNHHKSGATFKMRCDPRMTKVGAFLRKSSIDELPQLWCVLKGELSMVGPRPAVPGEVAVYTVLDRRRLEVKPGLTCIWQVSGRGDLPFEKQVALDLKYIDTHNLWLDLVLLARTIPAVLSGRGSY